MVFRYRGLATAASTSLKPNVREQETAAKNNIVGEETKGSEGPHYSGKYTSTVV